MFSFPKLLLLVLVVAAVWFGWRWYNRVGAVGRERLRERSRGASPSSAASSAGSDRSTRVTAEDMEKCPECGAYVAPHAAVSCGRPGCPYGR